MNYITTTGLRTKSSSLVDSLKKGQAVSLIHRSTIIGKIVPASDANLKTIQAESLEVKIQKLDHPRLNLNEIDRRYRAAMMKKHGKGLR